MVVTCGLPTQSLLHFEVVGNVHTVLLLILPKKRIVKTEKQGENQNKPAAPGTRYRPAKLVGSTRLVFVTPD